MSLKPDENDKKHHFDYPLLGKLQWTVPSEHDYELVPIVGTLRLDAKANDKVLGRASTLDHFIWDEIVQKASSSWCDCLTLWTKDLEFNLLLFGADYTPQKLRCAYFPTPKSNMYKEHLEYWAQILGSDTGRNTALSEAVARKKNAGSKKDGEELQDDNDARLVERLLPRIVVWNRYRKQNRMSGATASGTVKFTRTHAFTLDYFRGELQTIPVPTKFLEDDKAQLCFETKAEKAAEALYRLILDRYDAVTGRGSAMKRNLLTLASLLVDANIKVALVTGEPGTGKENLCKAIYYGDKLRRPGEADREGVFLRTTAVEIQSAMRGPEAKTPSRFLRDKLSTSGSTGVFPWRKSKADSPVIFIDELNKADQDFLGAMLRPLEQGETELHTKGDPKYILAASQHIDDLAQKPPQDFWTRISHQLRVVHPLSRVTEEDGEAFLESFFYSQWWSFIEAMIRGYDDPKHVEDFVRAFLGEIPDDKLKPSRLCNRVKDEFLNTLVPLVSHDTLSVRGARSILSQVFARLSWFVRFEKPLGDPTKSDEPMENQVARLVNSAVQDVMAILNAARATPAGMEETKPTK